MKRKIKFRAKTTANGHWVYGSLIDYGDNTFAIRNSKSQPWVQPDSIGQFTGLLDRNGKEIYEGDILLYIDRDAKEHYREVVYHRGCFMLHNPYAKLPDTPICHHMVDGELNWEVIGNIHEQSKKLER